MSYLDPYGNADSRLVDILLRSWSEIKFNEQNNVPATSEQTMLPDYASGAFESDDNSFYDNPMIMNTDPIMTSAGCDDKRIDVCAWRDKQVDQWTSEDVLFWVADESSKAGLCVLDVDMPKLLSLTGADLISMTLEDYLNKISNDSFAKQLYNALQNNILNPNNRNNIESDVLTTLQTCALDDVSNVNDSYLHYNYGDDINFPINTNDSTMKFDHDSGVDSSSDSEQCYESFQHNFNEHTFNDYNTTLKTLDDATTNNDSYVHYSYVNSDDINSLSMNANNSPTKSDDDSSIENSSDSEKCYKTFKSNFSEDSWLFNNNTSLTNNDTDNSFNNSSYDWSQKSSESDYSNDHSSSTLSSSNSDDRTSNDKPKEEDEVPVKKRPGRPRGIRKKKPEKIGRLWEFLRDLLHNPQYNPSIICWDDYEFGKFRFVHSEKVAQMWGSKRENSMMTFDKFSRAMRYYYKCEVLKAVHKRLVYQFGTKATGWRTPHPILR